MSSLYVVDANVMMEAARTYYAFQRVPGFWQWMAERITDGTIRTASLVGEEIEFPQELVEWVAEQGANGFFIDVSDPAIQAKYAEIAHWVVTQPFGPEHIAKFLDGADPWIISAAVVLDGAVVTQERQANAGSRKVKIPNVCEAFEVRCVSTFQMLEECGASF